MLLICSLLTVWAFNQVFHNGLMVRVVSTNRLGHLVCVASVCACLIVRERTTWLFHFVIAFTNGNYEAL